MATPRGGYNPKIATLQSRAYRKDSEEAFQVSLTDFKARLKERRESIEEEGRREFVAVQGDWGQTITPASFGRRLLLPANRAQDIEQISQLNQLYHAETTFLQQIQHSTISEILRPKTGKWDPKTKTAEEQLKQFRAVHKQALL